MERINQFDFYDLSRRLGSLNQFTADAPIDQVAAFWAAYQGREHLVRLMGGDPIELGVSRAKADALVANINGVITSHFTALDDAGKPVWKFPSPDAEPLAGWVWGNIRQALADFELIFAEEMREAATYRVPDRGIYSTRKLVDDADCAFPKEIGGFVPPKTKLEWKAAGRCMAFGMFTACGFHVARGVEGTLESYFHCFSGRTDEKQRQWGEYLDLLEKTKTDPYPNPKTLGELKQLKDDWRNPLMHPRVVLEEPDARAVFNNGETLIMMMAQELAAAAKSGVQPSLALVGPETTNDTQTIGAG